MTVLDLPLDKQMAIAKRRGLSLEDWRASVAKTLAEMAEYNQINDGSNPRVLTGEKARLWKERYQSEQIGVTAEHL